MIATLRIFIADVLKEGCRAPYSKCCNAATASHWQLGRFRGRKGDLTCPRARTRVSRNARPIISRRAIARTESARRRPRSERGARSASRTRAARTTARAARGAARRPRRRVGRPAAGAATAEFAKLALENLDRPLDRPQLTLGQ